MGGLGLNCVRDGSGVATTKLWNSASFQKQLEPCSHFVGQDFHTLEAWLIKTSCEYFACQQLRPEFCTPGRQDFMRAFRRAWLFVTEKQVRIVIGMCP